MTTVVRSNKTSSAFISGVTAEVPAYLDDLGVTWPAIFSVRHARQAWGGACLKARNNTNNAEADVAFTGGALRSTSVATVTVVGASGYSIGQTMTLAAFAASDDVRVTTWYDQSGNGRHFIQATAGNQPSLYLAGTMNTDGGKPCVVFDRTGDTMSTSAFARAQPQSVVAAMTMPNSGANGLSWTGQSGGFMYMQNYPAAAAQLYAGTLLTLNGVWWGLRRVVAAKFNGASSAFYVNTELNTSGNAGATGVNGITLNGDGARYQEFMLIDGASTDLAAISTRLMAYFGIR